jgi:multiple sugar transport system permease protein
MPALFLELFVLVLPLALGVVMSLLDLTPRELRDWTSAPFVGMDHYRAWIDPDGVVGGELMASLGRTLLFTVLVVAGSWLLGLLAALVLAAPVRGHVFWQAFFLVPFALPAFASVLSWRGMLDRDTGLVNSLLVDDLGLFDERPFWLLGDNAFWSIVVVSIWRLWPFAYLVIAAALRTVPGEILEAAALDGASAWRRFRSMTVPLTSRTHGLLILVMTIWAATDVSTPYLLFDASPPPEARLLGNVVYRHAFVDFDLGLASAANVMITVVLLAGATVAWRLVGRRAADA